MSVVKNINYEVGKFKLLTKNWEIPDQGISILTGESGSGKSTIIDLLVGFKNCKGMSWDFLGQNYCKLKIEDKKIGIVFQKGELFPHLNVAQCIYFAAKSRGKVSYATELERYLAELHLDTKILKQKTVTLSGGEKQRVALICALIGSPKILLLDEAFSALDINNKNYAINLVESYCNESKIPCLIVSHDAQLLNKAKKHFKIVDGTIL